MASTRSNDKSLTSKCATSVVNVERFVITKSLMEMSALIKSSLKLLIM